MFANSSWKAILAATAIFGFLGGGNVCFAQNCTYPDAQMGGIWSYPSAHDNITMTVINLTNYTLTSTPRSQTPSPVTVDASVFDWSYPFQYISDPITVAPFRTAIWKEGYAGTLSKPHFFGRIRFTLTAPASVQFPLGWTHHVEVDMTVQNPHGGYSDQGTWVELTQALASPMPIPKNPWCAQGVYCGGVWSTAYMNPIGLSKGWSYDMKNIMTLTSPELVVALYSPGPEAIVLVVRETNGDEYFGNKLEWVDNDSVSVPGNCNDSVYTK